MFIVLFTAISVSAYSIEPSTQIVVRNGKKVYVHKVEKGHTLYSISKAYGVTEKQIIDCNEGLSPATLSVDAIIYVPCNDKKAASQKSENSTPVDGKYYLHKVVSGDTFYSIARQYKISVDVLRQDNPSVDPSKLSLGQELRIRRGEVGYATNEEVDKKEKSEALQPNQYVVQAGDTVYSLARRAGLTEREFLALNKLRTASDLKQGMVVLLGSTISEEDLPKPDEDAEQAETSVERAADVAEAQEEVVEEYIARERLSGRSDDEPVVEEESSFAWFLFGDSMKEQHSFRSTDVDFMELGSNNTLKVALMLPFQVGGKVKPNYVDFYRGVLLAMEDLKEEGYSIDLTVFDTQNDARVINDIMTYEDAFLDAQLLIGPVFENELRYVVGHAESENIAVVSPLASIESLNSPVLFQMSPERTHKFDKVRDILGGDREIITIYATTNDNDFLREVSGEVTSMNRRNLVFAFNKGAYFYNRTASGERGSGVSINEIMKTRTKKTFIIVADQAVDIDRILTTLSSTKTMLKDRGYVVGDYDVVGNHKWTRLNNVDPQLFFKNNVSFVVSYHAKRYDEIIRVFDGRYINTYGSMPSAFSYRGYDAAMIFCRRMYSGLDANFMGEAVMPLTTLYRFVREDGVNVNSEWMLEQYKDDFTITAK